MNEQEFARRAVLRARYGEFAERLAAYLQTGDKNSPRHRQVMELLDSARARRDAQLGTRSHAAG